MTQMTEKSFLHKSRGKVSAAAFLAQHREYLSTGTLASLTLPVLAKLDSGELLPTPALEELRQAVLAHMLAKAVKKGERAMNAPRVTKRSMYNATIFLKNGSIAVKDEEETSPLVKGFDDSISAQNWADRRLALQEPGAYAVIRASDREMRVDRDESIARLYRDKRLTSMKSSSNDGKWQMRVRNDHAYFSRG